jgi:uncharacterized membrane protein
MTQSYTDTSVQREPNFSKQNTWSGIFFGIGVMATIDEIIFHQVLQWHHFYDHSTPFVGIMTDGFLTAGGLLGMVLGFFMFADLKRKHEVHMKKWFASFLMGAGIFQLFDGIIDHKILRVHQVRYVDNLWLYDMGWILTGAVLLIAGFLLFRRVIKKG